MSLRVVDLFAGIGGFSLGLHRAGGFETVQFVEIDPFCRAVLEKHWPEVPRHDDIRTFRPARGLADVVCGGYPCQPFSAAGKRAGATDDRALWPEMRRVVEAIRPAWVIGENVAGHVSLGLDDVLSDLEGLGYAAQAFVVPACAVDARHRRDRVWIVSYDARERREERRVPIRSGRPVEDPPYADRGGADVPNTDGAGLREHEQRDARRRDGIRDEGHALAFDDRPNVPEGHGATERGRACESREALPLRRRGLGPGTERRPAVGLAQPRVGRVADGLPVGVDGRARLWPEEPEGVPRIAHGVANRAARLRALGNSIVPQIAEAIGAAILEAEAAHNLTDADCLGD